MYKKEPLLSVMCCGVRYYVDVWVRTRTHVCRKGKNGRKKILLSRWVKDLKIQDDHTRVTREDMDVWGGGGPLLLFSKHPKAIYEW